MRIADTVGVRKIMLITSVLLLMLALCGCRTRITNNDDVSNVMYDEDGFMQEEYNMRREELGLSRAKKPIFTGLGAPKDEKEYEYDEDAELLEDYDPDNSEEDGYEDPDEPVPAGGTSTEGRSSPQGGSRVIRRRVVTGESSTDSEKKVTVTLDANGGSCDTKTIRVKKGSKYGTLPTAARSGYDFAGWYTKREDDEGKKVTASTKMTATKSHTLYAHWTKVAESSKIYTVTFNTNSPEGEEAVLSGSQQIAVAEGGIYQGMPSATCTGYSLLGWFTEATEGSEIKEGSKADINADQTLYAHWDKDPMKYWTVKLNKAVSSIVDEDKPSYNSDSDHSDFLQDGGMKKGGDSYDYLIFFGKEDDAIKGDKPTIVIPKEAISGDEREQLIYKYKLINELYENTVLDATAAASDLDIDSNNLMDIIILPAAEGSGGDGGNSEE